VKPNAARFTRRFGRSVAHVCLVPRGDLVLPTPECAPEGADLDRVVGVAHVVREALDERGGEDRVGVGVVMR
jgi:hypothetical protein